MSSASSRRKAGDDSKHQVEGPKTGGAFIDLIRKKAAVRPDEPFSIDAVRETEGMLLNQLHDMSFGFATVTTKVDAYPEEGVVDLTVHAKTGPACRFGPITVTGDYDIPEAFVRSEVTIKEGRAFRASMLANPCAYSRSGLLDGQRGARPQPSSEKIIPIGSISEQLCQVKVGAGLSESGKQDVHALAEFQRQCVQPTVESHDPASSRLCDGEWRICSSGAGLRRAQLVLPARRSPSSLPARVELTNTIDAEYGIEDGTSSSHTVQTSPGDV